MLNNKIVNAKVEIINILNGLEVPITVSQMILNEVKSIVDAKVTEVLAQELQQSVEPTENKDNN